MIRSAKWIWRRDSTVKNDFAYFLDTFDYKDGKATLKICAETDYIAYINGKEVGFGQFAGYPDLKFYDEIDVTGYCKEGKNVLSLTVRYEGVNSATHIDDGAGVIFTIEADKRILAKSSPNTLSSVDGRYVSGVERSITVQLGLAADMQVGDIGELKPSLEIEKTMNIKKRPVKKTELYAPKEAVRITSEKLLYDLGREEAGYVYLTCRSEGRATVKIAYGEHIADGGVRYLIGARNFSLEFHTEAGEHYFCQKFVRVAARYLEVIESQGVEIVSIGIIPALYPLTERGCDFDGLDRQIYETSVRTLRLCMNTHYEDCPWREQALYVLDSRNQMLLGYDAFKETEFQRENLVLISHGGRDDGFLELTYPAINTPAIPFFSVMYPVAVFEYIKNTGDLSILDEVFPRMLTIMEGVKKRIADDCLIHEFPAPYWNFYEWSDGSSGEVKIPRCHLILNCAFLYSYVRFKELAELRGIDFYVDAEKMRSAIMREFYDEKTGLFRLSDTDPDKFSELGQAFAILVGLGDERAADAIKAGKLIPATLSMLGFVYDALLEKDEDARRYILEDIRKKYGHMLASGATSFWETLEGESAFRNAGSLCHGWSAIPIRYLKMLL